jgi:hypothetical protein
MKRLVIAGDEEIEAAVHRRFCKRSFDELCSGKSGFSAANRGCREINDLAPTFAVEIYSGGDEDLARESPRTDRLEG